MPYTTEYGLEKKRQADRERQRKKRTDPSYIASEHERLHKYRRTKLQNAEYSAKRRLADKYQDVVETAVARGLNEADIHAQFGNEELTAELVIYIVRRQARRADHV